MPREIPVMPREIPVSSVDDLPPGGRKLAFVDGRSVVLFNIDGALHAIDNSCPHNGSSLASGKLEGRILQCPAHGLRFDLATGRMPGQGGLCLAKLPVQVRDGQVVLEIDDGAGRAPPAL